MRRELRLLHLRLSVEQRAQVEAIASQHFLSEAAAFRTLLDEALAARRTKPQAGSAGSAGSEIDLHLLVAIEQVIALVESILPEGRGSARNVLADAVLAAQRRLDAAGAMEDEAV